MNIGDKVKYKRGSAVYTVRKLKGKKPHVEATIVLDDGREYEAPVSKLEIVSSPRPMLPQKSVIRVGDTVRRWDRKGVGLYKVLEVFKSTARIKSHRSGNTVRTRISNLKKVGTGVQAEGPQLANIAQLHGILRGPGECDEHLRKRVLDRMREIRPNMPEYKLKAHKCRCFPVHHNCKSDMVDALSYAANTIFGPMEVKMDSKMKRLINRLNGVSLAEENLVELTQDVSVTADVEVSLLSLLKNHKEIQEAGLGKDALVKRIRVSGASLVLTVSEGEVTREENGALAKALQGLVAGQAKAEDDDDDDDDDLE